MKPPLVTAYVAKGTRESIDPGPSKTEQSERSLDETFTWNWGTPNLANTKKSLAIDHSDLYDFIISFLFLKLQ